MARSAADALRLRNVNTPEGKSLIRRIFNTAMNGLKRFGCARDDDVVTREYDMPDAPSSRPSMARTTSMARTSSMACTSSMARTSQPPTRNPSYARVDSSLLDRSQSARMSPPHAATQVLSDTSKIINARTFFYKILQKNIIFCALQIGGEYILY
jgi:hypothetical protein